MSRDQRETKAGEANKKRSLLEVLAGLSPIDEQFPPMKPKADWGASAEEDRPVGREDEPSQL